MVDDVVKQKFYDYAVENIQTEMLPEWKILWDEWTGRIVKVPYTEDDFNTDLDKWDDYVKPEKRDEFKAHAKKWYAEDYC